MIPDPLLIVWGKEKKNQLNIKLGKKHEYLNWENCKSLAWSHKNNVNNQKFLIRGACRVYSYLKPKHDCWCELVVSLSATTFLLRNKKNHSPALTLHKFYALVNVFVTNWQYTWTSTTWMESQQPLILSLSPAEIKAK